MSLAAVCSSDNHQGCCTITLAGKELVLHPDGVLFWPSQAMMIVADLHLEKGSSFARKGVFLPPYDSQATLIRLGALVDELQPECIVALGDSFHDKHAALRLSDENRALLADMQAGRQWVWLAGNHDPIPPRALGGMASQEINLAGLTLRHEPLPGATGEIAGHLHPCAKVKGRARSVRRPCFVENGNRLVMPAFGALTGGLNVRDGAFSELFERDATLRVHMLGDAQVYTIDYPGCQPDARLSK